MSGITFFPDISSSSANLDLNPPSNPLQASSSTVQRRKINKDWTKDPKTKTAKCKVCDNRIKVFSHQCGACKVRICSDCSEADGANSEAHKAVAKDHLDEGCWCGFPSKFNPAFKGRMPDITMRDESVKAAASSGVGKRKRGRPSKKEKSPTPEELDEGGESESSDGPFRVRTPAVATSPFSFAPLLNHDDEAIDYDGGDHESPEGPFRVRTPAATTTGYYFVSPPDNASAKRDSRSTNDADVDTTSTFEASSAIEEVDESRPKRRKANNGNPMPADDSDSAQEAQLTRQISGESSSSLSSVPSNVSGSSHDDRSSSNIIVAHPTSARNSLPPPTPQAETASSRPRRGTRAAVLDSSPPILNRKREPRTPSNVLPKPIPKPVLEDHIVIIGAGAIGMFTALQIAEKSAEKGKKQKITVVDINREHFALASGHSSSFLTCHGMKESCNELMTGAINEWIRLTDAFETRKAIKLVNDVYTTTKNEQLTPSDALPWFNSNKADFTTEDGASYGLISPGSLSKWLLRRCQQHGVEFRFDHHPTGIKRDKHGQMLGVSIQHARSSKPKAIFLSCSALILAAGAFTPDLQARLFPNQPREARAQALSIAQWVRFDNLALAGTKKRQGIVIPPDKGAPISLISRPTQGSVVLSAAWPVAKSRGLGVQDALAHPLHDPKALCELAGKHIVAEGASVDFTAKGVAGAMDACYVSGRPVLGEVSGGEGAGEMKAWAAYGFGMVGLTMAPGVGKVLAEMALGECGGKGKEGAM